MWQTIKTLLPTMLIFGAIDLVWIGFVMNWFYQRELGDLARRVNGSLAPRWGAALLVYILIPLGIVLFVKPLVPSTASYVHAFRWGALFGLVVYGVYDLTNRAVLQNWSLQMTIADIVWGSALCGITSIALHAMQLWKIVE